MSFRRLILLRAIACLFVLTGLALAAQQLSPQGTDGPLVNPIVNAPDTSEHDTQSTTAIVRIPGTSTVVAAYTNSAAFNGSNTHLTSWSRSTDDGGTWGQLGPLPDGALGDGGSPVLAISTSGTLFLTTKAFQGSGVPLFRSNSNGASWLAPVNALPGFSGNDFLDTPWMTVDNFSGTGQGNVYAVVRNFAGGGGGSLPSGVYFSRSTDNGGTFTTLASALSGSGTGPNVLVGKDHAVYVFWWINLNPAVIRFVKSTNLGISFGPITTAATLTGTGSDGDLGLGFKTNSFPQVAVDPTDGRLFLVYNDKNGTDKGDIYEVESGNGGANWSTPFVVNNDGPYVSNRDQFMPNIAVDASATHLIISWYDRRSDPGNSLIERWGIVAHGNGTGPNFRMSTGSWPVVINQDTYMPSTYMGSYDQITGSDAAFYSTWGDNRSPNPANTPLPHANQPDVRFAKMLFSGAPRGDLDRDLQTDRTVFRPSNGVWYSALTGGGATITGWGAAGDIDVPGDYDGDGKTDIAVFRPSSGLWFIVQSANGNVRVASWGQNGDVPMAGDFDSDGKDDLVIFRPGDGNWFVSLSGGGTYIKGWGIAGDIAMVGDYDGDNLMDIVAYRPSSGVWYILKTGGGSTILGWGTTGDVPVAGDFDGDGKADPTVFRPSTGDWFISRSTGGTTVTTWGMTGDIPVSGDFDGDGKTDVTIWRNSNGVWFSQLSAGGFGTVGWGISGDKPSGRVPGS